MQISLREAYKVTDFVRGILEGAFARGSFVGGEISLVVDGWGPDGSEP